MKPKNKLFILSLSTLLCTGVSVLSISDGTHFLFSKTDADVFSLTVDSNNVHASDFIDGHASFTAHNGTAHFEINNGEYLENGVTTLREGGVIKKYFNSEYERAYGLDAINVNYTSLGSGYVEVTTCYNQDFELTTTSGLGSSSTTHVGGNFYYIKAVGGDININSFTTTYGCFSESTPSSEPDPSDNKSDYHYDADDLAGFAEIGDNTYYYVRGKIDGMDLVADNFQLRSDESSLWLNPAFLENSNGNFQIYFELDSFINSNVESLNPHLYYKNKPFIAFNGTGDVRVEEGSGTATDDGSHAKIGNQYLKISYWWGMPTIRKTDTITVDEKVSDRYLRIANIADEAYLQFTGTINTSSVKIAEEFVMPSQYDHFDSQKYNVWEPSKADMDPQYSYEKSGKYTVKYYVNVKIEINPYGYDASGSDNQYIVHMNGQDLNWDFMGGFDHVELNNKALIGEKSYWLYSIDWGWEASDIWLGVSSPTTSFSTTYVEVIEEDNKPMLAIYGVYAEGTPADYIYHIDWKFSVQSNGNVSPTGWNWDILNAKPDSVEVTDENKREFNAHFDLSSLIPLQEQSATSTYACSIVFSIGDTKQNEVIVLPWNIDETRELSTKKYRIVQNDAFWWHVGLIIENK